jgi:cobalamin biosynthesis Mg chelatase CobN
VTASAKSVQPGATVLFRISAYTNLSVTGAPGKITSTLTPSSKTPAFAAPVYTVGCSSTSGTTCNLTVPNKSSQPQVEAQVTVPKTATAGETVTYRATVTVTDGSSTLTATATAPTITVAKAATTPTASSSPSKKKAAAAATSSSAGSTSAGSTVDIPGLSGTTESVGAAIPLGALPAVAGVSTTIPGISTTVPAGNASNLFPQINPTASPSPAPGTPPASSKEADPVADSSRIPLSLGSSEFGAQIVGLIVLLLGVAIAVTRLSLRKTRPNSNK